MKYNPKAKLKPKQVADMRKQTREVTANFHSTFRDDPVHPGSPNVANSANRQSVNDHLGVIPSAPQPKPRKQMQPVGSSFRDRPATPRHIVRTTPNDQRNHGVGTVQQSAAQRRRGTHPYPGRN